MSVLSLRRFRAERLLRQEFRALRGTVIAGVRARLRAAGITLDDCELEACYAQAWQGLYAAVLEGQEIANPSGWLCLVTFRRAVDEHRAQLRARRGPPAWRRGSAGDEAAGAPATGDGDLAGQLYDRARLRQLFEALRLRLGARELQAAVLCYLQGLSRAEAAAAMGVSEARMRKLMDGSGLGRPGVAGKVGELVETIRAGGWCEEQSSLMRGLAFGVLDPHGERYRMALAHSGECPACRAYVISLRGLAAALPPLPSLLRAALGGGAGASGGAPAGALAGGVSPVGAALPASGGAGGGWLLAGGPLGAKLAAGCALALGVGAGCAVLAGRDHPAHAPHHARSHAPLVLARASRAGTSPSARAGVPVAPAGTTARPQARSLAPATPRLSPSASATREFGPEQAVVSSSAAAPVGAGARRVPAATAAAAGRPAGAGGGEFSAPARPAGSPSPAAQTAGSRTAGAAGAAREFAPG